MSNSGARDGASSVHAYLDERCALATVFLSVRVAQADDGENATLRSTRSARSARRGPVEAAAAGHMHRQHESGVHSHSSQ